jgi:hypothetical protein
VKQPGDLRAQRDEGRRAARGDLVTVGEQVDRQAGDDGAG